MTTPSSGTVTTMLYPVDALDTLEDEYMSDPALDTPEELQPPGTPLIENNNNLDVPESIIDSPPPHQVVDMSDLWWLDEQMEQLDISVDQPAAEDESPDFYARLISMLSGPGYAEGRNVWKLPILTRHLEGCDPKQFDPILEGQTPEETGYILRFGEAWLRNACALRKEGSQSTPIDDERWLLLALLSAAISSLARAITRQDREGQLQIVQSMEIAIEGVVQLGRIERRARQKCGVNAAEHA